MAKAAQVPNAEYSDASADSGERSALEVLADAGDVQAQNQLGRNKATTLDGWEVGKPAPTTKYIDRASGEVVDQTGDGQILVLEGDTITQSVVDQLARASK